MKKIRIFCLVLCLILTGGLLVPAAAKNSYTYTVRIYAGAQGTFADGSDVLVYDSLSYGDRINFSLNQVSLKEGSKYYVKGIREAGHDNSEVGPTSFLVTRDIDYVVAYGVLGSAVAYTANYVDGAGNRLAESETYYGNEGDKPVVAYIYIEGWQPQAYNLTKTLTDKAEDNVFDFVYTKIPAPQSQAAASTAAESTAAPPAETAPEETPADTSAAETEETTAAAGAKNEPAEPTAQMAQAAETAVQYESVEAVTALAPPAELLDLDAVSVPPAASVPEKSSPGPWLIVGLSAAALAAGTAVLAVRKKRKSHEA
jgi:hypothetical protein